MSEFDGIQGLEGWSRKLESMLVEARQVAQKEDNVTDRINMSDRLTSFIHESRPNTSEIEELDKIAEKAATGLLLETIEKRLADITARTAEYTRLRKKFMSQAEENEAAAESIRLERIIDTVDSATETINAAKNLKDSLKDNVEEKEIAGLIDETVGAIERLRTAMGTLL